MTRLRAVTHFGVQARRSIKEYTKAVQRRYFIALKKKKPAILDELFRVSKTYRKS